MATPFFFILGRPRSGTTLLKALFDAHPNVIIPPELPIFLPLYQKFKNVKNWDRKALHSFVDHVFEPNVFNNRRIENLRIDRDKLLTDLLRQAENVTIQELLVQLNKHAYSPFPKEDIMAVGDKNPVYSVYTQRLLSIFPDAKFIAIVRDYRDNFVSLRNLEEVKLEAPVLTLQTTRWRIVTKTFLRCQRNHPQRFYVIRYEDLVSQPEEQIKLLCGFLGIPYVAEVFRFHEKRDEILKMFPNPLIEKIHKSLMNPVNTGRMNLWKSSLTPDEVKMADQLAGITADKLLYKREYKKLCILCLLKALPMTLYAYLLFALMRAATNLPYSINRRFALALPLLVKFYVRLKGGR